MMYHANSLEEIAEHFETNAARAKEAIETINQTRQHTTHRLIKLEAEQHIWLSAASILRNTQLGRRKS